MPTSKGVSPHPDSATTRAGSTRQGPGRGKAAPRPRAGRSGPSSREALRRLPQTHEVLEREDLRQAIARHGRGLILALVRERLEALRAGFLKGDLGTADLEERVAGLAEWAGEEAEARTTSTMRPVINATGVILHTNLGRAILSEAAGIRMMEVARAYTTLEYDLARGARGSRSSHIERVLGLIFPGKACHVVNNNAAAVLLALNTLAEGKEVVVSRGELVEIGGSFRIPDIMRKSGAILREVGTTNKTRLQDYERALGPATGLLLKVHPSNYRIVGFVAQVALQEVAALGKRRGVHVLMDQGSGNLIDLRPYGIKGEPTVQEALDAGADVVCFSADKMLGGPQAGLLVGRADLIKKMRENSLSRALRVDKVTHAALEASLLDYLRGTPERALPVIRMIAATRDGIERRARRIVETCAARSGDALALSIVPGTSLLGGGSAPEEGLPTALLAVASKRLSTRAIEERLRGSDPPVIARIEGGKVLIDLRTVPEDQDDAVERALAALSGAAPGTGSGGGIG